MKQRDKLFDNSLFILLVLMSVFATVFMTIKLILVCLILIYIVIQLFYNKTTWKENKGILVWMLVYVASNSISIIVALLYGNIYALNSLATGVLEPIVFFAIIEYCSERDYIFIINKLRMILILICIYDFVFFLSVNGILPFINQNLFVGVNENVGGLSIGFTKITSNNIPWIMFLFPLVLSTMLLSPKRVAILDYIAVGMSIVIAIITLRSSFLLELVLTPIVFCFYIKLSNTKYNRKRLLRIITVLLVLMVALFGTSSRVRSIVLGSVSKVRLSLSTSVNDTDSGGYIRLIQIKDLLETWQDKPLFGWGASANAKRVVRSDIPGAYEMQYFAMLMQKGLLGFGIYVFQVLWIILMCIRCIRKKLKYSNITLATLVAFTLVVMANATNPYFGSFDRLILFFTPIMAYRLNLLYIKRIEQSGEIPARVSEKA